MWGECAPRRPDLSRPETQPHGVDGAGYGGRPFGGATGSAAKRTLAKGEGCAESGWRACANPHPLLAVGQVDLNPTGSTASWTAPRCCAMIRPMLGSPAMDVGGWLRGLGLDKYEAAFRENGIDEQVLRHVTAEDLRQIGVSTVGDRRKLLAAIGELTAPALSPERSPPPVSPCDAKSLRSSAERRPITVMFCDLVGSTALASQSRRRGLAQSRQRLSRRSLSRSDRHGRTCAEEARRRADGPVRLSARAGERRRTRGAGGARDPARACRDNARNAGKGAPELAARIGLECGPVVVEATGEVFGEAPNIAARVQGLAEPGDGARDRERAAPDCRAVRRRRPRRPRAQGRAGAGRRSTASCARAAGGAPARAR